MSLCGINFYCLRIGDFIFPWCCGACSLISTHSDSISTEKMQQAASWTTCYYNTAMHGQYT
jgi:hypothetical protein